MNNQQMFNWVEMEQLFFKEMHLEMLINSNTTLIKITLSLSLFSLQLLPDYRLRCGKLLGNYWGIMDS